MVLLPEIALRFTLSWPILSLDRSGRSDGGVEEYAIVFTFDGGDSGVLLDGSKRLCSPLDDESVRVTVEQGANRSEQGAKESASIHEPDSQVT